MKQLIILSFLCFSVYPNAQINRIELNRDQAERLFIENNLELLAAHLEISRSDAELIRSKTLTNPNLSIGEINFWKNGRNIDELPPLAGNWGKTTQISAGLEQLIWTAGKRKKLIDIEKLKKENSKLYFEELLNSLKRELRKNWTELMLFQAREGIYGTVISELDEMIKNFRIQYLKQNISRTEMVRLQGLQIQFENELTDIEKQKNEVVSALNVLLLLPPDTFIVASDSGFFTDIGLIRNLNSDLLQKTAIKNQAKIKSAKNELDLSGKKIEYEKAMRIPDLTFSVSYDRGGSIMRDFVGFGISMDLPVFDRNRANIQIASLELDQNQLILEQKKNEIKNEIEKIIRNLQSVAKRIQNTDPEYHTALEELLPAWRNSYLQKNIGLIEYIDFLDNYVQSKNHLLQLDYDLTSMVDELEYLIGKDLNSL